MRAEWIWVSYIDGKDDIDHLVIILEAKDDSLKVCLTPKNAGDFAYCLAANHMPIGSADIFDGIKNVKHKLTVEYSSGRSIRSRHGNNPYYVRKDGSSSVLLSNELRLELAEKIRLAIPSFCDPNIPEASDIDMIMKKRTDDNLRGVFG